MKSSTSLRAIAVAGVLAGLAGAAGPRAAAAQDGLFAAVIEVNGLGITRYEIAQRARLIQLLGATSDPQAQAEADLIDDRLRIDAATRAGIVVSEEAITQGMGEFAGRANMTAEQFLGAIAEAGVEQETFRDFVRAGLAWRDVIRAKYTGRIDITPGEIDRAMAITAERGGTTRVLVSEFIVPTPPGREAEARALAGEAAAAGTEERFSALARKYSAAGSRGEGGRLPWMDLGNLPPQLRPVVLGLQPGQASAPIALPNAIAVFFLRALEEGAAPEGEQVVGYMEYALPAAGLEAETARLRAHVARCGDLYGAARGQNPARLVVHEGVPLGAVPAGTALALAPLDPDEAVVLPGAGGGATWLMLCERARPAEMPAADAPQSGDAASPPATSVGTTSVGTTSLGATSLGDAAPGIASIVRPNAAAAQREAVRERLVSERLARLADGDLAELRANAVIRR